jgi:Acyltransferase
MPRMVARVLQRVVVAPLVIAVTVLLWTTLPLWLIGAGIVSPLVPGWLRPVRLLWLGVVHLSLESLALVELFGLWIASGFGWKLRSPFFERIHYDIAQVYLVVFFREARRVLRLEIETVGPAPDAHPGDPLLVFCRHAGPGDSFTLMYALMHWYGREPRVVLKETLAWDPMLGVLLTRLPSRFISSRPSPGRDLEAEVGELARNLDADDAFVIFP